MSKRFVNVALCQRNAGHTKSENIRQSVEMIKSAKAHDPNLDVVVFSEYNYYKPTNAPNAQDGLENAECIDNAYIRTMSKQARQHHINIIPGSFTELFGTKTKNSCPFIDRNGKILAKYSKIHLMDGIDIKESDTAESGNELCVFNSDFGRIGIMLGYDLRFPELPRSMVLQGADIIFCPACFPCGNPLPSRTDHWDILVQSTALYNLTWVCAVNQFGEVGKDQMFGRSMVVNPWGTCVAAASGADEIVYATLDMDYETFIRTRVSSWENRRPDVYEL